MKNDHLPHPQIAPLGKILGIWAHPDDESLLSAGIMMAARANGQDVAVITATRGEMGSADETRWPHANLGNVRQKELEAVLHYMDINNHYWLGYADGECIRANSQEAINKICDIVAKEKPDTILTFGPEGLTGHDDHKTICKWATKTRQAVAPQAQLLYAVHTTEWYNRIGKKWDAEFDVYFNIDKPPLVPTARADVYFELSAKLIAHKLETLRMQISQYEPLFNQLTQTELDDICSCECFMRAN